MRLDHHFFQSDNTIVGLLQGFSKYINIFLHINRTENIQFELLVTDEKINY